MSHVQTWLSSSVADSLCWSLLHSLWQGMLWGLLLAFILAAMPRSKPGIRYAASLCCLVGLALGVIVTWSILRLPAGTLPTTIISIRTEDVPEADRSISVSQLSVIPSVDETRNMSRPEQIDGMRQRQWSGWWQAQIERFSPYLVGMWFFGVAFCLLRCVRHRSAAAAWRHGEPVHDPAVVELLAALQNRMKILRPVRLIASVQALGPCVMGTLSPIILIPTSLVMGLTPEQWRAVLTHELAHIRRWDDLVNFGQQVLESMLFFNPTVWWISRQVRIEREACCDAWGARLAASPITYAQVLVDIAEKLTARAQTPVLAFADERSGSLMDRVRRLVTPHASRDGRLAWPAALALLVVMIAAVVLLQKGSDLAVFTAAQFLTDQERVSELAKVSEEVSPQAANDTERLIISGTLRTEDGGPLPQSTWISTGTHRGNSGISASAGRVDGEKTDQFRVEVSPGVSWLKFTGDGYATAVAGPFVSGRTPEIADVSVVLKRGVPVPVRVTDDSGRPVTEAKVTASVQVSRIGFGVSQNVGTDSTGSTILNNVDLEHSYSFSITAPGFQKLEVPAQVLKGDGPLELQMTRAQIARGKILGPDGAPLSGATLKVLRKRRPQFTDSTGRTEPAWATSNPQGEFVLDQLLDGTVYDFVVEHPDYAYALLRNVQPGDQNLIAQLQPGVTVSGTIRGTPEQFDSLKKKYSGYRLLQQETEFFDANELSFGTQLKLTPVNGEVPFRIEHLPLGKLVFSFDEQRIEQDVTSPVSDLVLELKGAPQTPKRDVEFVFRKEPEIVAPQGKLQFNTTRSIPGEETQQGYENVTLVNGRVVTQLPVPCEIRMNSDQLIGFTLMDSNFKAQIPEGDGKYVVDIPVEAAGAVRGIILNADGTPASGVNVTVSTVLTKRTLTSFNERSTSIGVQANVAGEFFISPIPFGAKCKLRANREKFYLLGPEFTMSEQHALPDYKLQFNTPVLAGVRVLDPKGNPLRGVPVIIRCEHPRINTTWSPGETTNAQGEILIPEINPDMISAYQAIITPTKDYRNKVVQLQAGRTVEVTLKPGLFLEGKLVNKQGQPIAGQKLTAQAGKTVYLDQNSYAAESVTDSLGQFRFSNLPDEDVQIRIEYGRQKSPGQKHKPTPKNQITPITIEVDY